MVPVALPTLACGALFGFWQGAAWAMVGLLAGAALLHGLGRALGRERVAKLAGRRVARVGRRLVRHGALAIALLHLVPVAPFAVTNLVIGASRVRFVVFAAATTLAMLPTAAALALLGDRLAETARDPTAPGAIGAILLAMAIALIATSLARRVARASGARRR
ncbi:MAG: VTT domain-containing protein [Alphaproteobacteria bacterium]|nr:VTT domain-containing protein [Alphaproteobacteria bacterium]